MVKTKNQLRPVIWLQNTKNILSAFPKPVKEDFGFSIFALQLGRKPFDVKPMSSVGKGAFELRTKEGNKQFRVIFMSGKKSEIFILHCFVKKTKKTANADIQIARTRYKLASKRGRTGNESN